jgi:hypothetical protein
VLAKPQIDLGPQSEIESHSMVQIALSQLSNDLKDDWWRRWPVRQSCLLSKGRRVRGILYYENQPRVTAATELELELI